MTIVSSSTANRSCATRTTAAGSVCWSARSARVGAAYMRSMSPTLIILKSCGKLTRTMMRISVSRSAIRSSPGLATTIGWQYSETDTTATTTMPYFMLWTCLAATCGTRSRSKRQATVTVFPVSPRCWIRKQGCSPDGFTPVTSRARFGESTSTIAGPLR